MVHTHAHTQQLALLFDRANALATDTASSSVSDLGFAYESMVLLRPLISSTSSSDALTETYRIAAEACDKLPLDKASLKDVGVYLRGVSKLTAHFKLKKIGKVCACRCDDVTVVVCIVMYRELTHLISDHI